MNAPITETAKKPFINVVVDCYSSDEYSEGPSFVVIKFDEDELLRIGQYHKGLADMKSIGIDPFKVSSFTHSGMFLDPVEADPLNDEEQKSLRFLSDSDKAEWEDRFDKYADDDAKSQLWDLEGEFNIQTDMMNITDTSMSISGYIKHTNIRVESSVLFEADLDKIEKWVKEL